MPFISASAISSYNSIRGGAEGGLVPTGLLLDLYPNAAAAYSLRKLRTAYSGPAIEARKTVAGETSIQDIGFVDNELDTASLLTFADGEDVFVAKWYDQSGNGNNDAAQISASKQPILVSNGLVIKVNDVAAVDFDGTNDYLETDTFTEIPQPTSYFGVFKFDESKNQNIFDGSSVNRQLIGGSDTTYKLFGGIQITGGITNTNQNSFNGILSTTDSLFINNISVISGNAGSNEIDEIVMGSNIFRNGGFLNGKIQELIFYPSDQTANREGIEANINKNYNIYWDGSQTGLLDDYPNASAAYSLRALNSAYTGAAIKVRRSSDNEEQDINFLYDGTLDTESLLSFVGAGDGFVSVWYDQSGSGGNDAVQASASSQPQIVSSGSVINENGKISVKFNGTTDYIRSELSVGPTVTSFAVSKIVDEPDFNFIYDSSLVSGGRIRLGLWSTREYFADNGDGKTANPTTPSNELQNLFFAKHTNSDVSISVNQDTLQTVASTNFYANSQYWVIGARHDGVEHFLEGTIQELIIYPSDQSGNRAGIESNINSNYKIYWDGSQTGLLDDYPNASAAYSLRALSSAYTGPAIEVRKTVGGETSIQDIGFRYDGSLDTASLLSFAGSDDVFVAKWYDQSGAENNDAFQVSQSSQASIVLSGVLNTTNGNVAVLGESSTVYRTGYSIFNGADGTYSGFVVSKLTSNFDGIMQLNNLSSGGGGEIFRYFNTSSTTFRVQSWDSGGNAPVLVTEPINANSNAISSFIRRLDSLTTSSNSLTNSLLGLGEPRKNIEDRLVLMGSGVAGFGLESYFSEAILYPSDQSANRAGIESNINSNYNIYWDGSQTGLLDDYPNASAAYSLRALSSAYTGPAIEAMKTVGDETFVQNIGFLYDGSLDTASLLSFAGSDDVFVAKWYDQSGSNDVAQVSESAQPQIVSSGIVNTTSGNYAIDFSGATKNLVNETFDNSTQVSSVFTVAKSTSSVSQVIIDGVNLASRQVPGYYAGAPSVFAIHKGVTIKSAVPINTNLNLLSTFFDVNSDLYLNGDKILDSVNAGNYTREGFILGSGIGLAAPFEGSIFEIIVFDEQNKSSDRVGIETNINNHYTIYP